jgi:malonate transporter and related proteins
VGTALTLLGIVAPVFLVVAAGYSAVRSRFLPDGVIDPLVTVTVSVLMPSLLFLAMLRVDLGQAVDWRAVVAFFGAITAAFLVGMALSRLGWRRSPGESVSVGFSAFFGNVVMLGIPITERAYGGAVSAAFFGLIAFHGTYNYFVGFVAMELIRRDGQSALAGVSRAFVTTLRNPLMIGLLGGIAVNLAGLPVPEVMLDALGLLAAAGIPLALFSLGGVLTRYRLRDEVAEALMVSAVSLLALPALTWVLVAWVFALPVEFVRAAVIMAAMPPGLNGYIFASLYDRAVGTAANAVLIGTIFSVGTITLWLALLAAWT